MGDEGSEEPQRSVAAPLIFLIVAAFQFASHYLDQFKIKRGSENENEIQLHQEIKQLLHQASSLSQPSTFAQVAKLKRLAAAKGRELAKYQNLHDKDNDLYSKVILYSKVFTYIVLLLWFWNVPVASISQQLVQPFGRLLSSKTGGIQNNNVMIGIIPWLIVSARVSRFVRRAYSK